ncbi:MAG: transposase [Methanotrichaceae archaeon]|nr:transposase [Methanotrichaceae archaeon]
MYDHKQKEVFYPGHHEFIEVDTIIAPLLQAIWNAGVRTCNSCEENEPGIIWIEFYSIEDLEKFLKIIILSLGNEINDHPEANDWFCYRVLGYCGERLKPWHYDAHPNIIPKRPNQKKIYSRNIFSCNIEISVSLRFPKEDLDDVLEITKNFLAKSNNNFKEIDDNQWDYIKSYLPPQPSSIKLTIERGTINGIIYILRTGCRWREIPPRYGSYIAAQKKLRLLSREGLLDKILSCIQDGESCKEKLPNYLPTANRDNDLSGEPMVSKWATTQN